MFIVPLNQRIVVRPAKEEEVTKGGILIPEKAKEKPQKGEIMGIGMHGRDKAPELHIGDVVLYSKYGGHEVETEDGDVLLIIKEEDLLGVVHKSE